MLQKMKELISIISEADTAYYKFDSPIMSDMEYDKYYNELLTLEKESGVILSGSPTQKVPGEILESLVQVQHTKPMLSAEKTKSIADIIKFIGGIGAIVSWKLDGLTLVLRYGGGKLIQAITRGAEGRVGEGIKRGIERKNFRAALINFIIVLLRDGGAYIYLIYKAVSGEITAGEFVLYFAAIGQFAGWFSGIIDIWLNIYTASLHFCYMREFFEYPNKTNRGKGIDIPAGADGLSIELKT